MKMKKKTLKILSVVAIAIIVAVFIIPVFASDFTSEYVYQNSGGEFTAETEVSYQEYSSFYVTIPTSVSADGTGEISVDLSNVEQGYCVSVYATNLDENGKLDVVSQYGDNGKLTVLSNGSAVQSDGLLAKLNGDTSNTYFSVANDGGTVTRPGLYTGTIAFRVVLENL